MLNSFLCWFGWQQHLSGLGNHLVDNIIFLALVTIWLTTPSFWPWQPFGWQHHVSDLGNHLVDNTIFLALVTPTCASPMPVPSCLFMLHWAFTQKISQTFVHFWYIGIIAAWEASFYNNFHCITGFSRIVGLLLSHGATTALLDEEGQLITCGQYEGVRVQIESHREQHARDVVSLINNRSKKALQQLQKIWLVS